MEYVPVLVLVLVVIDKWSMDIWGESYFIIDKNFLSGAEVIPENSICQKETF